MHKCHWLMLPRILLVTPFTNFSLPKAKVDDHSNIFLFYFHSIVLFLFFFSFLNEKGNVCAENVSKIMFLDPEIAAVGINETDAQVKINIIFFSFSVFFFFSINNY